MPNQRVTELTEVTTPSNDAQMYLVNTPASSPADRRVSVGNLFGVNYISGLVLEWVSANSLRINPGLAALPSGQVIRVTSAITLSSMSLVAGTWYHLYLYLSGTTPTVEYVTTNPTAAYLGMARTKTGATTHRYIGSVYAMATNTLFNFLQSGNIIFYRENLTSKRVVSYGSATVETTVSAAGLVPNTSRMAIFRILNGATSGGILCTGTSDDSVTAPNVNGITLTGHLSTTVTPHALDSSQAFTYWYSTTPVGGMAFIDIFGYYMER